MVNEEQVKSEIIETARGLIQQFGIQKVTMQDIAKAANKGKSTLYYYFKNKEEILDAVVEEEMKEFFRRCKNAVDREHEFNAKLKVYITTKIDILEEKQTKYQFLIDNDLHHFGFSNYFKRVRFLFDGSEVLLIKSILQRGVESGNISGNSMAGDKEQLTAEIFLTAIRGLEMEVFIQKKIKNMEEKTDLMINILLNGLR
ncbi:MAG: TetR/AcrR family transcriptional regulator [Lewinella sp.]|jgi:AcrR family transcriptional regulator|uniref:TetR/AcrR family transcriptional regulator n=1 Tax=Lewinella sp. TaxID=2004506 RepID=UPI003D6BB1C3